MLTLVLLALACTTTTTMTTALPNTALVVNEHDYGPVGADGVEVAAPPGFAPLVWRLFNGTAAVATGEVPRTQAQAGVVAGAVAAAGCCIPGAVVAGLCLANPALIAAPFTCLIAGPGVLVSAVQAPGWLSIPFACAGAAAGSTPLLLGLIGQAPAPQVVLEQAPATQHTTTTTPIVASGDVPW